MYAPTLLYVFMWGDVMCQPDVATNDGVVTYRYTAKERGLGVKDDAITYYRVAGHVPHFVSVSIRVTYCAKCHTLVHLDIITNDCRGSMTMPVPWSIANLSPICASGFMSIPVSLCAISVMARGMS